MACRFPVLNTLECSESVRLMFETTQWQESMRAIEKELAKI